MNFKNTFLSFEGYFLSIIFETPHYLSEYVEYPVKLSYSVNESVPGQSYVIVKRYSDFDNLKKLIKQTHLPEQLPPKKLFGKFDMSLVNERQTTLEKFLKSILNIPIIGKSLPVTNFFQKEAENIPDYAKVALQQVSLDFRCEANWQVGKVLPEIGCRIKKCYISILNIAEQRKYILGWAEFGSEFSSINYKACHKLLKSLPSIKHEFIYPITFVTDNDTSVSIIRPFNELGSLHDYMLKVKPINPITIKYSYQPINPTLVNEISLFGRQILIALKYLHEKGFPYGHLHIRNVMMISDQKCALTDIENTLIGLLPQDRHFYVGILKKLTFEEIDIYCFGRLIFHMVFGNPLESTFIDNDDKLKWPTPSIREFLFSVLTEGVLKSGFPKIDFLLELNLFKSYSNRPVEKGSFKLSDSCKEYLQLIHGHSLRLLIADQKLVKSHRRQKEADAIEMKKKQQRKDISRRMKNVAGERTSAGDIPESAEISKSISDTVSSSNMPSISKTINKSSVCAVPIPPPPPPPAPPSGIPKNTASTEPGRNVFLNSISGFNKDKLRQTKTVDKSSPKI